MRINKEVEIKIYHDNKSVKVLHAPRGKKLLDLLRDNDIRISCPCSGSGTCGKCKVQFLDDGVRITTADLKHIPKEDLERGYRLACMSILTEDARIAVQDYNEDNIVCPESTSSENEVIKVANPDIAVTPDIRAYSEGLDNISKTDFFYGIGIDLGTTTIAVSHIKLPDSEIESRGVNTDVSKLNPNRCRELHQFETLATFFARDKGLKNGNSSISAPGSGFTEDSWSHNIVHVVTGTNHQRSYGTDVISRIKASKEKGKRLKELVVSDIEDLIQKLLTQTGCSYSRIKRIAIAGNTTKYSFDIIANLRFNIYWKRIGSILYPEDYIRFAVKMYEHYGAKLICGKSGYLLFCNSSDGTAEVLELAAEKYEYAELFGRLLEESRSEYFKFRLPVDFTDFTDEGDVRFIGVIKSFIPIETGNAEPYMGLTLD